MLLTSRERSICLSSYPGDFWDDTDALSARASGAWAPAPGTRERSVTKTYERRHERQIVLIEKVSNFQDFLQGIYVETGPEKTKYCFNVSKSTSFHK